MLKMGVINMSIDSKYSLEYHFNSLEEILWKWHTNLAWKYCLII